MDNKNKMYILVGVKRGTTTASDNTINAKVCSAEEFILSYTDKIWMSSNTNHCIDMLELADNNGKTYWLSNDMKVLFMLKAI